MRQLAKYAFTNARVRAMLSYLIDTGTFIGLLECGNLHELIEMLKTTHYRGILADVTAESSSLSELEKRFILNDTAIYDKVRDSLSGKAEKKFVSILMQRYEIEDLKVALRLWNSKEPVRIKDYISGTDAGSGIDYEKIVSAESLEELIIMLDKTDYKEALLAARLKFKATRSLFYLEASLDIDYYKRLLACVGSMSPADKRAASTILGIEIDGENIQWLIKLRKYYGMGLGDMLDWFIPGGSRISKSSMRNLYTSDGMGQVMDAFALGPYLPVKDLLDENIHLIENLLYEILLREVKKALSGNPFTIGTILGYLILKRRETRNVISLLYAKAYGVKKDELPRLINM